MKKYEDIAERAGKKKDKASKLFDAHEIQLANNLKEAEKNENELLKRTAETDVNIIAVR